jgi:hypothetical protein
LPARPASPGAKRNNVGLVMRQRRAAVRHLVYGSVLVIAQAATPGAAEAETFEDSFVGGDAQLDWTSHAMLQGGAVKGKSADDAPDGDGSIGVLRHDGGGLATVNYARTAKAEDSFEISACVYCPREAEGRDGTLTGLAFYRPTDKGGSDPEEGGFYRLISDYRFGRRLCRAHRRGRRRGGARRRLCLRDPLSVAPDGRGPRARPGEAGQMADQLSCRLSFLSSRAARSTRSRRSGISCLRRSSPSSRSALSSSASGFFGLGQTMGLDLVSFVKRRSRATSEFKRLVSTSTC